MKIRNRLVSPGRKVSPIVREATPDDLFSRWVRYLEVEKNLSPNPIRLYKRTVQEVIRDVGPLGEGRQARPRTASQLSGRSTSLWPARRSGSRTRWTRSTPPSRAPVSPGLRIHEAVKMELEVPCPEIMVLVGKGAKEALLPLTAEARAAADFLGGRWPIGARATQRRFEKAGFTPHQCRHHLGCSLAEAGADLGEIQDLLRHSSPATTRTYAAYSTDRLRAAQARRNAR